MEKKGFSMKHVIIILVILYVLSPIDMLPGFLLDDLAVVILGLKEVRSLEDEE